MPPSERQLSSSTQALLAIKGMKQESPIFVRIFKEESELEIWKFKDGRFQHFRTYPICAWSGGLGPKVQQGDRQAPEGFYTVGRGQMNPRSLYHLAFNIGFPNAYDSANGHTGSALMVHGDCKSVGCYAMTDAYIEEIYILAREAFAAGQTKFHVQALPFHLTASNMQRHRDSPWYHFWLRLKEGYDSFEATGRPPIVKVCSKQYMVNVSFAGQEPGPSEACPAYAKLDPASIQTIDGVPPYARGKPWRQGRGYLASGGTAAACDGGKLPDRAVEFADRVRAHSGYVRFAGHFPRRAEAGRNRYRANAEGACGASLYRSRTHLCRRRRKPPGPGSGKRGAAGELSGAISARAQLTRPRALRPLRRTYTASAVQVEQPDPNALQKLNRSGKGGKLPGGDQPPRCPSEDRAALITRNARPLLCGRRRACSRPQPSFQFNAKRQRRLYRASISALE